MNKNKKIIIIGVIAIIVIIVVGIGITMVFKKTSHKEEEGFKSNTNENVIKEQTVGVFKFTNVSLNYQDNNSVLRVSVTNTSEKEENLNEFKIHVFDKDHKEIVTLTGFVGDKISAHETKYIESTYADDLTNAWSVEYEDIE